MALEALFAAFVICYRFWLVKSPDFSFVTQTLLCCIIYCIGKKKTKTKQKRERERERGAMKEGEKMKEKEDLNKQSY